MPSLDNHLITGLPLADRSRLLALCEPVRLPLAQVLCEAGQATGHVYFPTSSVISMMAEVDAHHGLEVGMAGREGMLGGHLALGVSDEPTKAQVQCAGAALRVAVAPFLRELDRSGALRDRLQKYLYVLMAQRAISAACLRFHEIGPRLARWLLMSQDRAGRDSFAMTQQRVSSLLGVRRVGVTTAAGDLQRHGLIRYHRGKLTVLDRRGLLQVSCGCYAACERTYAQTMKVGA